MFGRPVKQQQYWHMVFESSSARTLIAVIIERTPPMQCRFSMQINRHSRAGTHHTANTTWPVCYAPDCDPCPIYVASISPCMHMHPPPSKPTRPSGSSSMFPGWGSAWNSPPTSIIWPYASSTGSSVRRAAMRALSSPLVASARRAVSGVPVHRQGNAARGSWPSQCSPVDSCQL